MMLYRSAEQGRRTAWPWETPTRQRQARVESGRLLQGAEPRMLAAPRVARGWLARRGVVGWERLRQRTSAVTSACRAIAAKSPAPSPSIVSFVAFVSSHPPARLRSRACLPRRVSARPCCHGWRPDRRTASRVGGSRGVVAVDCRTIACWDSPTHPASPPIDFIPRACSGGQHRSPSGQPTSGTRTATAAGRRHRANAAGAPEKRLLTAEIDSEAAGALWLFLGCSSPRPRSGA